MNINAYCLHFYRFKQALFPILCLFLCAPCLLLAYWQKKLDQNQKTEIAEIKRFPKSKKMKIRSTPIQGPSFFLINQLKFFQKMNQAGIRFVRIDWDSSVLSVKAEALSWRHFSNWWEKWKVIDPNGRLELEKYEWHRFLELKIRIFNDQV